MRAAVFLGERFAAEAELDRIELMQTHLAGVCPNCGKTWVRVLKPWTTHWSFLTAPCSECPPLWFVGVPGALSAIINNVPDELLERELRLHLSYRRNYVLQSSSPYGNLFGPNTGPPVGLQSAA